MSCWRNYTCDVLRNVDKDLMKHALAELGVELDESIRNVSAPWAITEQKSGACDAGFRVNGKEIPVGIIWDKDGHMQVTGDFWNTGLNEATFVDSLSQIYQRINIETQLELNGWTVESTEAKANGDIELIAYVA